MAGAAPSRTSLALLVALLAAPLAFAQKEDASLFPPLNDDFARADPLSLLATRGASREQDASTATVEWGEPSACGGEATVWFSLGLLSGASGLVRLDTFGSDYDTVLAVYRGASLETLRPVACNDDADPGTLQSTLTFLALPGETYHVQVGAADGAPFGSLRLHARDALPGLA